MPKKCDFCGEEKRVLFPYPVNGKAWRVCEDCIEKVLFLEKS